MNIDFWDNLVRTRYFSSMKPTKSLSTLYVRKKEVDITLKLASISSKDHVLDIASEPRFYKALLNIGCKITRIDYVPCYYNYIKNLINQYNIHEIEHIYSPNFIENSLSMQLDKKFDRVISVGTMNYFPSPSDLLTYVSSKLKSSGIFVTPVKAKSNPDYKNKSNFNKFYDLDDINLLFETANLKITKIRGIRLIKLWYYIIQATTVSE